MIRGATCIAAVSATLICATGARAELNLCNRTSYRLEAAIGLEKRVSIVSRGWFKVDPGECRQVFEGALDSDMVYLHGRTPPAYGSAPAPQSGRAALCIRDGDFELLNARGCPASEQVRFSPVHPSHTPKGPTVYLAEEADYDDAQARLAGIQRLLAIAGYDAYPIDGVTGARTQAALNKFLGDHQFPADAVNKPEIFDTLMRAANDPAGAKFAWCNETKYTVMASLGVVERGQIVTRGWYRVPAGQCLRPDLRGDPHRLYSYGEAVDGNGRTIRQGDTPLAWGGNIALCTRDGKFELSDHKDCATRGLNTAGYSVFDVNQQPSTVVRFKEP
jgi:uncharacterized membrane protein